jgi:hypothetical protein
MINAVLVFNNAGQPRLTKFYTQLVGLPHQSSWIAWYLSAKNYTDYPKRRLLFNSD